MLIFWMVIFSVEIKKYSPCFNKLIHLMFDKLYVGNLEGFIIH
jgi:hypothetical protein